MYFGLSSVSFSSELIPVHCLCQVVDVKDQSTAARPYEFSSWLLGAVDVRTVI